LRTSECGDAASKRTSSRRFLDELAADAPWRATVDAFRTRNPRRQAQIDVYDALLDAGAHRRVTDAVLTGAYRPAPPTELWLNKANGGKKRVFCYPPLDELLFRVVNRLAQPAASVAASPWCRSFLPGGGARNAFRSVLRDGDVDAKSALRLDVRNYFNSIDVLHLLEGLPEEFSTGAMGALLRASLLDARVRRAGHLVDGGPKGIMAGTPIAPMLATLYLRDLDHEVAYTGATYARYSDDILVLAAPGEVVKLEALVRLRLGERGLEVNERKTMRAAPGDPWDFLGFRHERRTIRLAPISERKLRAKMTRLARRLLRWRERNDVDPDRVVASYIRRSNRRIYGVPTERGDFSWGTWFLPLLGAPDELRSLDHHVAREIRYAATGRRIASARRLVPYAVLIDAGYLPLVSAFWAMRDGISTYDTLVTRRTGVR
jgi:Reverse transcriptase (RNA-dependent DNA polymerase)